jgi:gamma-tubulin complex component 5
MIGVHSQFIDRVLAGACLGPKLQPIRDAILDMLDLSIKLEDAQQVEASKHAEAAQELSRLSEVSSPLRTPSKRPKGLGTWKTRRLVEDGDEDEDEELDRGLHELRAGGSSGAAGKPYQQVLRDIHADFERHLRFVAGGLRGVARASRDEAAGKWDLLAEMMEVGIGNASR